jgi:transketolase
MAKYNKYVQIGPTSPNAANAMNDAMIEVAEKHDNVVAVLEDMGFPAIAWFKENAPERIVECGIAEANGAVVAAGLAAEGFMPFLNSFYFAVIGRAYNPIRQSILVDRFNVKFFAREGAWGETGISHNHVEGIGMTRVMPNMVMLNPADAVETKKCIVAMGDYIGPVIYRQEMSPPMMSIFTEDYPFDIGKAYPIKDGKDATIIATGYMVTEAIKAIDILEKDGLDVGILNMSTLKPLDEEAIIKVAEETGAIVTAENGSIIGGLGEGVATVLAENLPTPVIRVGIEDEFSQSGLIYPDRDDLKIHFALAAEDLAVSVKECIAKRDSLKSRR